MIPKFFPEANVNFAADQKEEYYELPAFRDQAGNVVTLWQLSDEEKARVLETGEIWLSTMTFNKPLQPVYLSTEKPLEPIKRNTDAADSAEG